MSWVENSIHCSIRACKRGSNPQLSLIKLQTTGKLYAARSMYLLRLVRLLPQCTVMTGKEVNQHYC